MSDRAVEWLAKESAAKDVSVVVHYADHPEHSLGYFLVPGDETNPLTRALGKSVTDLLGLIAQGKCPICARKDA